jgi:DNA-binding phage protein
MTTTALRFPNVVTAICEAPWADLNATELTDVACCYYYFSIQFRENLLQARALLPNDEKLQQLAREEMDTDNLSPWPGVASPAEKMNHDEFMRRTLRLNPPGAQRQAALEHAGENYLAKTRQATARARAMSIASYEDGGLEAVFKAFLNAPDWTSDTLRAFRHFLVMHIKFDSDEEAGHGALARHLQLDDSILPLWEAFRDMLFDMVPKLRQHARPQVATA